MRGGIMLLAAASLLAGCASTVDVHKTEIELYRGDYGEALQKVYEQSSHIESRQGPIVRALDVGMVQHYAGDYAGSNASLSEAEKRIGDAYTKSLTRSAASFVLNDNTKEYPGEDFEDIYSNVFMSLNYAHMEKISDAMVEIRRSSEKQQVLKDIYSEYNQSHEEKIHFTHSALASWLGMLFSHHLGDRNDAQYYARQIDSAFADEKTVYPFEKPEAAAYLPVEEGKARLYLLSFTNIEPRKQEERTSLWTPSGNWMTVATPVLKTRESEVSSIVADLDGKKRLILEKIEDISQIATTTYLLKESGIYAKAIMRATGKLVATDVVDVLSHETAASSNDKSGGVSFLADMLTLAANLFGNFSERADVRMSHFLPGCAYVGSVDLAAGEHLLTVTYMGKDQSILKQEQFTIFAQQGKFLLIESFCLR